VVPSDKVSRVAAGGRIVCAACLTFTLIGSASPAAPARELLRVKQAGSREAPAQATASIGNMNQVMRGILFPNANVIFDVQLEDPGAEKPSPKPGDARKTLSITAWGDALYPRWEIVSYAAVALEESALLLMRPERRCQNGRPVPVGQAEWTRYAAELAETARAVYAASQSKNRDAVISLTDRLNEACANCHSVYRRGPDVDRCLAKP
jgi:hypothetical protein